MWEFLKNNAFVIGALTGGLAGSILTLVASYLRREKYWLGYSKDSRNIVQRGHSKLRIHYENKDIVSLDSHTIQLQNIGNRPLLSLPVRLECIGGGDIVDSEVQGPDGVAFTVSQDENSHFVAVTPDLLNPGEFFSVGLTIANANQREVKVVARGALLEVKEIGGARLPEELLEAMLSGLPFPLNHLGKIGVEYNRFRRKRNLP